MYQVLIVDDENIVRIAMKTVIRWEEYGFTVCGSVDNGQQALDFIAQNHVDVVFTDLKMPVVDGLTLIREVKVRECPPEVLILSNYSDFELVREGMALGASDYLLKLSLTPEKLAETLTKLKKLLDSQTKTKEEYQTLKENVKEYRRYQERSAWEKLLTGQTLVLSYGDGSGGEPVPEDSALSNALFLFQPRQIHNFYAEDTEGEAFRNKLTSILQDLFEHPQRLFVVAMEEGLAAAVYRTSEPDRLNLAAAAQQIQSLSALYLGMELCVLYSDWFQQAEEALNWLELSKSALEQQFYEEKPACALIKDPGFCQSYHSGKMTEFADNVLKALKNKDPETVKELYLEICGLCQAKNLPPEVLKKASQYLLQSISIEIFPEEGEPPLFSKAIRAVWGSKSLETLLNLMNTFFDELHVLLEDKYIPALRREVTEVLQYIEEHIDEKLTLTQIAQQVTINETYLCTLFKEQVGKSIISYINERKMEEASRLITGSDLLLKDVAKQIGISDQYYFNRLFKQYYGVTPSKYKKMREGHGNIC